MQENWAAHPYYKAFALYLIDELLVGSKSHKLSGRVLHQLYTMIYEEGIGVKKEDYGSSPESNTTDDARELWAAQCREQIDIITYCLTANIRDIIYENTVDELLTPALKVKTDDTKGTYFFSVDD